MYKKVSLFLLVLVIMSFLFVMFSCKKDTDSGSSISEIPPPEPFTEAELIAMDSVGSQAVMLYRNISASSGQDEAARQVVAWALTQPYVANAGNEDKGKIVYIEYETGVLHAIFETPDIELDSDLSLNYTSLITKDASQFPEKPNAVIYNGAFDSYMNFEARNEKEALEAFGYNVQIFEGLSNPAFDVNSLFKMIQYNFIGFISHGIYLSANTSTHWSGGSCIRISVPITDDTNQEYSTYLREKSIVPNPRGTYYMMTPFFVQKYCKGFGQNTFAILSACETMNGTELTKAFSEAGLDACIGWRGDVDKSKAPIAIKALLDLLTARRTLISTASIPAESIPPGNEADDPFNLADALNIMHQMNYGTLNQAGALLDLAYGPNWGLMPHLDNYTTNSNELILHGSFGSEKGEVKIEDESGSPIISLSVIAWSESEIHGQKPQGNLSGNLVVYARGLISNPLPYASGQWVLDWGNSGTRYFAYSDSWQTTTAVLTPDGMLGIIFNAGTTPMANATVESFASVALGTPVECSMFISYSDNYASSPFRFSDSDPLLRTFVTFTQKDLTPMGKISGSFSGKLGIYHPLDPFNWETVNIISAPFTVTYLGQGN